MIDTVELLRNKPPMPALVGLLDIFGLTQEQVAKMIGVPQPKLSHWYRGERGIDAAYIILITTVLAMVIESAEEGKSSEELTYEARRALELRTDTAKPWLALQMELNQQLPPEAREHALALEERLSEKHRAATAAPEKHEARPNACKLSGSGSVRRNTPIEGASRNVEKSN